MTEGEQNSRYPKELYLKNFFVNHYHRDYFKCLCLLTPKICLSNSIEGNQSLHPYRSKGSLQKNTEYLCFNMSLADLANVTVIWGKREPTLSCPIHTCQFPSHLLPVFLPLPKEDQMTATSWKASEAS